MDTLIMNITEALVEGNEPKVSELCKQALQEGVKAQQIMDDGLVPGMDIVGKRMKLGDMFIPEVLRSAQAMQGGLKELEEALKAGGGSSLGTVVIGTVQGDLHDIGKNLVVILLEGAGFDVVDLGVDNSPQNFVDAIIEHNASIVALSALLTTTTPVMGDTVKLLTESGLRNKVKVMAGGAPITQEFVDQIGADAYGANAAAAAEKAKKLIS